MRRAEGGACVGAGLGTGRFRSDGGEGDLFPGVSAETKGVVDYYGSTSFIAEDTNPQTVDHCLPNSPEGRVMGGKDMRADPSLARALSAECNIDEGTLIPPVLIFHGTKDRTVNCTCSAVLYRRLRETVKRSCGRGRGMLQ